MIVVALLTCHNRKELTLRCLEAYFSQAFSTSAPILRAVVVDDGSTDGTGEAVGAAFGHARVISGDGSLYWARGMHRAESAAVVERPDYLLWLNDDVKLERGAVDRLLGTAWTHPDAIVTGALVDDATGVLTYSGVLLSRWHPLRVQLVDPGDSAIEADTFNGNVVLVPRRVYERIGAIDGGFAHGQADFDYGLRARSFGFRVVVAPGAVGTCTRGRTEQPYSDTTLSLGERWQLMQSATGLPMRSSARYLRRHGGPFWPVFWAVPYAKLILSALVTAPRRWRSRAA